MIRRLFKPAAIVAFLAIVIVTGYLTRERWQVLLHPETRAADPVEADESPVSSSKIVVGEQAQLNLGLKAKALKPQTYWKTIQVPGMVVDRPGQSDRGVVALATGVVSRVYHFPGDTVRPGEALFNVKLLSESLHLTQTELFKATQEITLAQAQRNRLASIGSGGIPESRIIEVDNQIKRLEVAVKAYRQELQNRGIASHLIDEISQGTFVNEVTVTAPAISGERLSELDPEVTTNSDPTTTFEVQELKVDLGQQVQAGQLLCLLSSHQRLAIEGQAFRDETPLLERSVRESWPVEVDFREETTDWGELKQEFRIRQLANTIDPVNRTFAFRMPLENQSRVIDDEGRRQTLWRFRPGQKVLILVRVEKLENVYVVPSDAVATEGPESFVFTQNVNTFERKPVRILLRDRQRIVLANDGTLIPGTYVVQSAAEQLNRMVKSGANSGIPKGYHIHADGSLHKNEDEGK
ncbi:hypothetical protein Spb1_20530 [Planctopirus ephydatiae]|uniref:HlyD family secretion protein n=1 Tax=Planctopirus ephydatiae TaxID=2528019 RepID=A0A518GNA8_9PLAN|nr:hypothetical protein [Planctopirus ephydatiae]QDV30125.1 hypothetical protein Spb1_20530 [Planctopirus ephydatiae]